MTPRHPSRRVRSAAERWVWRHRIRKASSLARLGVLSGGGLTVYARHLETGADLSLASGQPFKLASLVKVPLAVQALACIEAGRLSLNDQVPVAARHVCPGSGWIAERLEVPGVSLSIANLLRLSLAVSDNTATDVLFELVGGPAEVQAALRSWGHAGVRVDRPIRPMLEDLYDVSIEPGCDARRILRTATPSESHARSFWGDPRDTATPRAMADLLADVWAGNLLRPQTTSWLVEVLRTCATGRRRFRALLPPNSVVIEKTGTLWGGGGRMAADAAVIRLSDGGYATVTASLTGSQRSRLEQEAVLARAAEIVHDTLGAPSARRQDTA